MTSEYATKTDVEICFTCKYFDAPHTCTKKWRLHQKDNSTTYPDLWCEHYEADMDKKEKLEAAMSKLDTEDAQVIPENPIPTHGDKMDVQPLDVVGELRQLLTGLNEFDKNCQQQIILAARADNNLLVAETKGMLRVVTMLGQQLNARIEELSKRTMN